MVKGFSKSLRRRKKSSGKALRVSTESHSAPDIRTQIHYWISSIGMMLEFLLKRIISVSKLCTYAQRLERWLSRKIQMRKAGTPSLRAPLLSLSTSTDMSYCKRAK